MKLFELYKQPITRNVLREDKTLKASLKICEGIFNLLESIPLSKAGNRVTDPTALKVKKVAIDMFGRLYSSARIANGTVHRMSISIRSMLSKPYRYIPLDKVEPKDRVMMDELKSRFYKKLQQEGVDTSKVDVKYHGGAGIYINIRTKIDEDVSEASYDNGIDFEPQPAYAGVKGISRDTGYGEDDRKAAEKKQQNIKLNQTWQRLVRNLNKLDAASGEKLKVNLKKVADVANQKGFQLSPTLEEVLGR